MKYLQTRWSKAMILFSVASSPLALANTSFIGGSPYMPYSGGNYTSSYYPSSSYPTSNYGGSYSSYGTYPSSGYGGNYGPGYSSSYGSPYGGSPYSTNPYNMYGGSPMGMMNGAVYPTLTTGMSPSFGGYYNTTPTTGQSVYPPYPAISNANQVSVTNTPFAAPGNFSGGAYFR